MAELIRKNAPTFPRIPSPPESNTVKSARYLREAWEKLTGQIVPPLALTRTVAEVLTTVPYHRKVVDRLVTSYVENVGTGDTVSRETSDAAALRASFVEPPPFPANDAPAEEWESYITAARARAAAHPWHKPNYREAVARWYEIESARWFADWVSEGTTEGATTDGIA